MKSSLFFPRHHFPLWVGLLLALPVWPAVSRSETVKPDPQPAGISASLDRADAAWADLVRRIDRTVEDSAELNPAVQQMSEALADLRMKVAAAENEAALAFVKMASYTAWLIHTESRKVPASRRLIQITRATGRSEEVERYQQRHEALLANIEAAANQYLLSVSTLARLDDGLVDAGFAQYEAQLVELGLAEQIRLNHLVREQVNEYARNAAADLEQWKRELEQLRPTDERGEGVEKNGD